MSNIEQGKKVIKLQLKENEVFLGGKKFLPRQAYKRRILLGIFISAALKDHLHGNGSPTPLSIKVLIELLKLPTEDDINGHLLKPIRYLCSKLDGALISLKAGGTTSFYLDLEHSSIEIG